MSLEFIDDVQTFQQMEEEWNRLLEKSASHVPFLRHEFLSSWWQTLGGGEWDEGDLSILASRGSSGELLGIAPFFRRQQKYMFLGSYEISDYLDIIAARDQIAPFTEAIFTFLQQNNDTWDQLDLYNLRKTSPSLSVLKEQAKELGWQAQEETLQPAPCLTLPDSWENYLEGLDSKYKHEIERKLRRAEGYFLPVDWYLVEEERMLDSELDDFMELMSYHPEKAAFLTSIMETQLRSSVHKAFNAGWVQLSFLTVGGKKAAGYLNFDYNNRIWVYNSGLNPMFENISPGWVLLSYLIKWAIQEGRTSFDFMRGDEEYKYHFGGKDQYVVRLQIDPA